MEDVDENVEILNIDSKKAFGNFTGTIFRFQCIR